MTIRALHFAPIAMALYLASLAMLPSPVRAEVPNGAQSDEASDLDLLSRASDDTKTGLALARDQTSLGDLTGAMATLERLLINHPDSDEAQLLHASLLCRLDDRTGASSEFAGLRKRDFRGQAAFGIERATRRQAHHKKRHRHNDEQGWNRAKNSPDGVG